MSELQTLAFPYKNGHKRYTKQLFLEEWRNVPIEDRLVNPPFTLYTPKEGYVCFSDEYINDADPTGYTTSKRIFGEYTYWKILMKASWFRKAKETWDEELDAKLKAEGFAKIRSLATGDDAKALQAAKYLANLDYKEKTTGKGRGRPSKEEVAGELKQAVREEQELVDIASRIGLVSG